MKILTSYFYQIRNFKPYQIPLSKVTDMYRMFEECNLPGLFSW